VEQYEVTFRTWFRQSSDYRPKKIGDESTFSTWYDGIYANGRPVEGLAFSVAIDDEVPNQWEARAVLLVWAENEDEANDPEMKFNQVGLLHDQLAHRTSMVLGDVDMSGQWLIDEEATRPSADRVETFSRG
jgi:hypothetical protein